MDQLQKSANYTLTSEGIRDVIRRAKEAGVNIFAIISQLQGALPDQQNEGNTFNDLANTYQKLLEAMKSIMLPYDVRVEVGSTSSGTPIILDQKGLYMIVSSKRHLINFSAAPAYLYEPMKILYNFIFTVTLAAEEIKNRIKVLENVLRYTKAISL
jgi:hypothetical protein